MVYQEKPWLKLYDPRIEYDVTVEDHSLYDFLKRSVGLYTERPALTFSGKTLSFTELKITIDRLATALHKEGFKKGDRLAIMLPNTPHYFFSLFSTFCLGGIVVQVNPMYVEREIEYVLNDSGAEYMVVLEALYPRVKKVQANTSLKKVLVVSLGGTRMDLSEGDHYLDEFLSDVVNLPVVEIDRHEDVAILQYTGGTTGAAKGVMLTHYNLLANLNQVSDFIYNAYDHLPVSFKLLTVLPMFHVYGLSSLALTGIREGANQIILPRFDVQEVIDTLKYEKPFLMAAVPTMYFALNSHPELAECGLDEMYFIGSGGAPLPVEQVKTFEKITGATLRDGYGLSEASPSVICSPPFIPMKYGSIGIPFQSTVVRVVRKTEDGIIDVPVGEAGELIVKGPQVMKGYWNRPEDTAEVIKDGWLFTGDIGKMDEEGYFYIIDREKDMIIASGYNVYPREVEDVIYQLKGVEEVIVIGVCDAYRGETVKAFVKLIEGHNLVVEEIMQFARANLAPYKAPKVIEILAELPKSSVGKLLRRVLRDEELSKVKA
ncbi:MAG: long-chain fatty acid--CoA ligase [Bacillus sp. (in: Bacteria)]|nr:long-chain fatty acid--CoA ligase [Bacillus sp. (in: firmicutes)]